MSDPRICVVGAGSLSTRRIYPYIGAAGGELVGVCDLDRTKAVRNARRFGGNVYTDMEEMLEAEAPDGAIICIGPEQHAALAPVVMGRGIPVYTEKPPAPTAEAALAVARLSDETGVLCMTAFKKRYATAYERAKHWLETFPGDALYSISADYASGAYANDSPRHEFLLDFAIHLIDLMSYLGGNVAEVFSFSKGPNAYAVSLKFANGGVGSMNLTDGRTFAVPTEEIEITVKGGNFMTIHNSSSWRITQDGTPVEWREPQTFISAGDSGRETGHLAEIEAFLSAIREGRATRSNIYESYKSMVLYEAIKRSAATSAPVAVRYQPV
jgi:myo-inositol 2-dehydrogenase/D-chiro-inositol 1-dehydrogenase